MEQSPIYHANILIIDDQEYNISLLERILKKAGFINLYYTTNPHEIQGKMRETEPDIVLLDLHMPGMDGIEVLKFIRQETPPEEYLPVLMLTADDTPKAKQDGLLAGVNDFITKPYNRAEVVLRINNLLRTRFLHKQLLQHNAVLEQRVHERTRQLQQAQLEVLQLIGRAAEYRDDITGMHTQRVGQWSGKIAAQLGLPAEIVEMIQQAAPLHDVGKIGIPDHILLKPGRLETEEFELIKRHTLIGANILKDSSFAVLKMAEVIAMNHHEKWDGTGYPKGLKGEEIPIEARIVALADFFDALTHDRPYKRAWSVSDAIEEIRRQTGKHFDPDVVEAFFRALEAEMNKDPIVS